MLGCSRRGTCAGQPAWNSDTGTNPCQVLRPAGNQPLAPPPSPENQHFGRGKGPYLLFLCVVSPRKWKENERKSRAMTRKSIPSSSSPSPKALRRILFCLPTSHKHRSGPQLRRGGRKNVRLGSGELQGFFFPVAGNFSWEGNFIPGPGRLPDHFKADPWGE